MCVLLASASRAVRTYTDSGRAFQGGGDLAGTSERGDDAAVRLPEHHALALPAERGDDRSEGEDRDGGPGHRPGVGGALRQPPPERADRSGDRDAPLVGEAG